MGTGSLADGLIFTLTIYISRFKGSNKKSLSYVLFYSKLSNGLLHCSYKKSWGAKTWTRKGHATTGKKMFCL